MATAPKTHKTTRRQCLQAALAAVVAPVGTLMAGGGIQSARTMHVDFLPDQETYRFTLSLDGWPKGESKLTTSKGPVTTSPFLKMGTRT